MSVLYFESDDFTIQRDVKGDMLCHSTPGFCLLLFYSTHCQYCQSLIPIFKSLPTILGGCTFGMLNVSLNKKCVAISQKTITPITYVPYIVLYINGKPYMTYKGPNTENDIVRFIKDVSNNLQQRQQFSKQVVRENKDEGIPEYLAGIGKPLSGDKNQLVCYLTMSEFMQKS